MAGKSEEKIVQMINEQFSIAADVRRDRRIWIEIDKGQLLEIAQWLKQAGFDHLSAISVADWPDSGTFSVTCHVWSQKEKVLLTLKTRIERENAVIESLTPVWDKSAGIHERELHELFGVNFNGNDDLSPLFLEDWKGPPPFQKDFDWREYTREEYFNVENEREHVYYD